VIRTAVRRAMREMGNQFVLGEDIDAAMARGRAMEAQGYTYSYDMLGEAALTADDARRYFDAYRAAIAADREAAIAPDRRQPRHLGQALGAASALRGRPARPRHGRAGAARQQLRACRARPGSGSASTRRRPTGWTCRST
jgi:RHH-type proline utilization regulon transcriptional repressor/proline dehydrogenase/delta 1-pyrroline-5-carboxylate dehydrogenase